MSIYVGIDLAWKDANRTGVAAVDDAGRLMASGAVKSDEEIETWLSSHAPDPAVVAVDAPLVVANITGQRRAELLIGRAYGKYGASAYSANRSNPLFNPPRAEGLVKRLGWVIDPATPVKDGATLCIEVYPHPALVGLFQLPQRVLYKKGADRRTGFIQLANLLSSIAELRLDQSARWASLVDVIVRPAPGDLNRIEDELDAILCAHLAWLWHHRPGALTVFGSVEEGYIVAPPPPVHAAALPAAVRSEREELTIEVRGIAPGTFATARGARWRQAILERTTGVATFAPGERLELEVEFRTPRPTGRNDEWDLDNLLKPTMDALIGPLGTRPGGGRAPQADDERIDSIIASKRAVGHEASVGGRIILRRRPSL